MLVLGLIGGVGSGKSEVLRYLNKEYHAYICQMDEVAKMLQKKGNVCFQEIVSYFENLGDVIVGKDGELDRGKLGEIVFHDHEKMKRLNEIVHPAVIEYVRNDIREKRKEGQQLYVVESALLPDVMASMCDRIWYIYVDKAVRISRLVESRGYTIERIERMMSSQPSEDEFRSICTDEIDNSYTFENTKRQIGEKIQL